MKTECPVCHAWPEDLPAHIKEMAVGGDADHKTAWDKWAAENPEAAAKMA